MVSSLESNLVKEKRRVLCLSSAALTSQLMLSGERDGPDGFARGDELVLDFAGGRFFVAGFAFDSQDDFGGCAAFVFGFGGEGCGAENAVDCQGRGQVPNRSMSGHCSPLGKRLTMRCVSPLSLGHRWSLKRGCVTICRWSSAQRDGFAVREAFSGSDAFRGTFIRRRGDARRGLPRRLCRWRPESAWRVPGQHAVSNSMPYQPPAADRGIVERLQRSAGLSELVKVVAVSAIHSVPSTGSSARPKLVDEAGVERARAACRCWCSGSPCRVRPIARSKSCRRSGPS